MADFTKTSTCSKTSTDSYDDIVDLVLDMRRKDRRFRNVCRQLVLMNNNIRSTKRRYERALLTNRRSFGSVQRLRLMTLEGARDVFTEFANKEADNLDAMETKLQEEYGIDWDEVAED